MEIAYHPFDVAENAYVSVMKSILSNIGHVTRPKTASKILLNLLTLSIVRSDVLILNWTENSLINKSGKVKISRILSLYAKTIIYRLAYKKILYVRHNNYPHNTNNRYITTAKSLISIYEKLFDSVVVHSGHLADNTHYYVPHPLYPTQSGKMHLEDVKNGYLIFGRILRYKKILEFIDCLPSDTPLTVAGPAPDPEYLSLLMKASIGKSITFIPKYISSTEAEILTKQSNGIVISNDEPDMIVSGSFFYSLSMNTPVYTIETQFIKWLKDRHQLESVFAYTDIKSLADAVATNGKMNLQIKNEGNHDLLFGNQAVEDAWRAALKLPASLN